VEGGQGVLAGASGARRVGRGLAPRPSAQRCVVPQPSSAPPSRREGKQQRGVEMQAPQPKSVRATLGQFGSREEAHAHAHGLRSPKRRPRAASMAWFFEALTGIACVGR